MNLNTRRLTKNLNLSARTTTKFTKNVENKKINQKQKSSNVNSDKKTTFNTLRKKDTDARVKAQIITTLKKKSLLEFRKRNANTKYRNLIMFLLILFTEATFIFSTDFSIIYESKISYEEKLKKRFLSKKSFINEFLTYFSIVERARALNPFIILCLFCILIALQLSFLLLYKWNTIVEKIFLNYKDKEGNFKIKNFIIKFYYFVLKNFDLIFLLLNYLAISSLFCRTIKIPVTQGGEQDFIEVSSIKNDYFVWLGKSLSEKTEPLEVHFLSDDVKCSNSNRSKIFLNFLGLIILLLNLLIKSIFNRIYNFTPSVSIPQSKFGNFDILIDFAMLGAILLRVLGTSFFNENFQGLRISMIFFFVFLILIYLVLYGKYPYYCKDFSNKKKLQLSFLITLTATHIVISNTFFGYEIFNKEITTLIFFLISVTLNIRIGRNNKISSEPHAFLEKILNGNLDRDLTVKEILGVYYSVTKFIHKMIVTKTKNQEFCVETKSLALMITTLFEWHRSRCSKVSCICQKQDLEKFLKHTSLKIALDNEIFEDSNFTLKGILLCEILLRKNSTDNKEENRLVFFTYLEFLINYFGKPVEAKGLLTKKMYYFKRESEEIVEFEIMKECLDNIVALNHMNGTIALATYHDTIHLQRKSKDDSVDVQNHIMFLNSIERLKQEIIECSQKKLEILINLTNTPDPEIIYEGVKKFARKKVHIFFLSEKLLIRSRGIYPPCS